MSDETLYTCIDCKKERPKSYFYVRTSRKSGITSRCKTCFDIYKRAHKSKKPWKYIESSIKYLTRND